MTTRDAFLDQVRRALEHTHLPAARPSLSREREASTSLANETLAAQFAQELTAVGGEFHQPKTHADVVETVLGLLHMAGGDEVLAWADDALPLPGLSTALRAAGFRTVSVAMPLDGPGRAAHLAALDRPRAGLTGAFAGVADTGSLALLSGPGRPRAASLLPLTHIALLPVQALVATMAQFFAAHPGVTRTSSNLVFVTGPSRTADIEMVITRGVHGPRHVHVVLVP